MVDKIAGVDPKVEPVVTDDPVAYVLSLNLHRRHLDTSQRAMVAARAREVYDRAAKERQDEGRKHSHESRKGLVVANLPEPSAGRSRDQAAEAVNVGGRTVDYGTKVLRDGTPELVAAVDEGRMAVSTALREAVQVAGGYQAVSDATGVGRTSLWHFVAGRGGLSLAAINRLAEHFGLRLVGQDAKPATSTDTTHGG